jgi:hypothetical protein
MQSRTLGTGTHSPAALSASAIISLTRAASTPSFADLKKNSSTPGSERRKRAISSGPSATTIIFGTVSRNASTIAQPARLGPGATTASRKWSFAASLRARFMSLASSIFADCGVDLLDEGSTPCSAAKALP